MPLLYQESPLNPLMSLRLVQYIDRHLLLPPRHMIYPSTESAALQSLQHTREKRFAWRGANDQRYHTAAAAGRGPSPRSRPATRWRLARQIYE